MYIYMYTSRRCMFISVRYMMDMAIQWNPSEPDTIGSSDFVLHSEVSSAEELCLFLSQM